MAEIDDPRPDDHARAADTLNVKRGEIPPVHVWGLDQHGELVDVAGMRGRKVLLAFYIEDETGARTAITRALSDRLADLRAAGVEVVGVRGDPLATRRARDIVADMPFPMIEDRDYRLGEAFDVLEDERERRPTRALVLLGEDGRVLRAWDDARAEDVEAAFRSVQESGPASPPDRP